MNDPENGIGRANADGFRLLSPGLAEPVSLPQYGRQDLGFSPGGAMDCFALQRGNLMLGNPPAAPALEMIVPPEIEFIAPGCFVLTGARRQARLQRGASGGDVEHSRVYRVQPGDRIVFGEKQYGLRTYFCFRVCRKNEVMPEGQETLPFASVGSWADAQGRIRVLPGPEYGCLENPQLFFDGVWKTTAHMDRMGMRLAGEARLVCTLVNMISEAVADGTVQLTPDGPIVLLRHRQTTGGYPRIFNVISADIDLLGQYAPDQIIRFLKVSLEEARAIARQKKSAWERLCR
jgi:5-oxoprolinase (ATP-hydrolysing) subunit C